LSGILYAGSENIVYTMRFVPSFRVISGLALSIALLSAIPAQAATFVIPTDVNPYWKKQWYLRQIQAPEAWKALPNTLGEVTVAVIDAGVDITHPDLKDAIWTNPREVAGNGVDDDQNGFVDDIHGWNFVKNSNDVRPQEIRNQLEEAWSHGTFVASLIGARAADHVGMVGVNQSVKIMPLNALDGDGFGTIPNVLKAIRYAVNQGVSVINLSLAGFDDSQELDEMIKRARDAGVLVVAATGNGTTPAGRDIDRQPVYPVCFDQQANNVVGVSGTDSLDQHAEYANFGVRCTDLSAPGFDLFGARPSYPRVEEGSRPAERYLEGMTGTSLAAPLVSGVASLLKAVRPDLTAGQLHQLLTSTTDNIEGSLKPSEKQKMGTGRLNAVKALQAALAFGKTTTTPSITAVPSTDTSITASTSTEESPIATSFYYRTPEMTIRWLIAPKPLWKMWGVRDRQPMAAVIVKEKDNYFLKRWSPVQNKETKDRLVWNAKRKLYVFTDAKTKQAWEVDKAGKVMAK